MDKRFESQAEAPVLVESTLCSRFRCTKSQCAACAVVCPVPGAVRLTEEGAEITAACVGCGACASACPNGALRLLEEDIHLAQRIRERIRPGEGFRIACSRAHGRADLVLPCLSRLTEAIILEPIRGGAARVELLNPDCTACGFAKAAPQWRKAASFAGALCESAGLGTERVARLEVPSGQAEEARPVGRTANSRRAMFRNLAEHWQASETEVEPESHSDPARPFRERVQQHSPNPKRIHLLQVLAALPGTRVAVKVSRGGTPPVAEIEADHRCVGCNVCETLCPVGALSHREEGGAWALELDGALCTGCRVCEVACFQEAIRIRDTADLSVLFDREKTTLVSASRRTCNTCRQSFLDASSSGVCPSCRLSGDRREAIVRQFFMGVYSA